MKTLTNNADVKTAVDRAMEMMTIPTGKLPIEAVELAYYIAKELGGCGEIFITAYAIYAQVVEGYTTDDTPYHMDSFPEYVVLLHKIINKEVPRIVRFK